MENNQKIIRLELEKQGVEKSQAILNHHGHYDEALKLEPIIEKYRQEIKKLKGQTYVRV